MSKKTKKSREDIIEELIKARKIRRLTQKELAMKIGCPQPSISRIENRTSSPTLDFLEKWCEALKVSISIDFKRKI